jgi:alanyl-tRNA synthetase
LQPATVMVAASPDTGLNAGALLKTVLAAVGGRGGGSASLAQGTVPDPDQLDQVVAAIMEA